VRGHRDDLLPVTALLLLGSLAWVNLMALPAFSDEGNQIRWILRVIEAGEWLQPLGDGKPFEAWPMVPLVRWGLPPLPAARALHVIAGMVGAVLTYRLALPLSGRGAAFVSGALFVVCPFVVYLERLALSDMFLCVAGLWVLVNLLRFVESPSWPRCCLTAVALPVAALCKLPVGFIFCFSLPLALALMPAAERRRLLSGTGWIKVLAIHTPAALLALVILTVAILRLRHSQSPGFGLQDLIGIGLGGYAGIAATIGVPRPTLTGELTAQLSWPVLVLGCVGILAGAGLPDWRARWLTAIGILPMLGIGFLAAFWFSRYLLFALPPLIVVSVWGWRRLAQHAGGLQYVVEFGVLAICVGFMGHQSASMIYNPAAAKWSPIDRFQYFEAPGSGFGFPEAARFVAESPAAPHLVYTLDGHSGYQLLTYLPANWRSRIRSIFYGGNGEVLPNPEARLDGLLSHTPTWLVVPEELLSRDLAESFGALYTTRIYLHEIASFDKPGHRTRLGLYEVARR
jgi:Dolichyl-phosphate-mannose-protein mannosyltransferase